MRYLSNLLVEVTRNCNISCNHCMRGDVQRQVLSEKNIEWLFHSLKDSYIGTLTITGGEPSLVPHKIRSIRQCAAMYGVEIQNFYIVTNAKRITQPFMDEVEYLFQYCSDNEVSGVAISNDGFHTDCHTALHGNFSKLDGELGYLKEGFVHFRDSRESGYGYDLIEQGRAKDNCSTEPYDVTRYAINEASVEEGAVYLSAKGMLLADCNLSYETQDTCKVLQLGQLTHDFNYLAACHAFNNRLDELDTTVLTDLVEGCYE